MKIYHGSQNLIRKPQFGVGKVGNDFGLGFYCTESEDLAKEWMAFGRLKFIGNDDARIPRNTPA